MRRDEELNCMTFVAGRRASATGRVLVAHNEDDTGVVAVRHGLVPPARWPEGSAMPAEPGLAAIPQVADAGILLVGSQHAGGRHEHLRCVLQ